MPFRIGVPGQLLELPSPGRGITATAEMRTAVHEALRGGRTVDRVGRPLRTYGFSRQWLTGAEMAVLEGLAFGLYGKPPYLLFDPARVNLLDVNQASGGDYLRDLTGFYLDAVTPQTADVVLGSAWVGQAAVRVQYAHTLPDLHTLLGVGNFLGDVAASDPVALGATPVLPSHVYTASAYVKAGNSNGATVHLHVRCYQPDGARTADVFTSSPVTVTSSAWARVQVTFTVPSTIQFVGVEVRKATSAATGTLQVLVDGLQLEEAPAATAWVPGTGVPWVSPMSLSDTYQLLGWHHSDIAFAEVN